MQPRTQPQTPPQTPSQPQSQSPRPDSRPDSPVGGYVPANGLQMYYEVSGAGEPLLLLHGGHAGASPAGWADDVLIFSQQFRVFALDLRGCGRTVNPTGDLSVALMAEDVLAFCAALGLRQPYLCGHSDAGAVALELAIRHAALPRALVLSGLAGAGRGSAGGAGAYTAVLKQYLTSSRLPAPPDLARLEQGLPDLLSSLRDLRDAFQRPDALKSLVSQTVQTWNAPLGYQPEDLRLVTAPSLVLLGDRDELLPVDEAVSLYHALPGAELAIVPNTGHGFTPYMRSLAFDFLRRQRDAVTR